MGQTNGSTEICPQEVKDKLTDEQQDLLVEFIMLRERLDKIMEDDTLGGFVALHMQRRADESKHVEAARVYYRKKQEQEYFKNLQGMGQKQHEMWRYAYGQALTNGDKHQLDQIRKLHEMQALFEQKYRAQKEHAAIPNAANLIGLADFFKWKS